MLSRTPAPTKTTTTTITTTIIITITTEGLGTPPSSPDSQKSTKNSTLSPWKSLRKEIQPK